MSLPQPFQYQGSKRALASLILQHLPAKIKRLVEPFCGSAAISIAAATRRRASEYWLNDSRYFSGISFDDFIAQLARLNHKNALYLVSYDGRLGNRSYGKPLPAKLHLTLMELEAGRSSQATLLGRQEMTVESLYLSPVLAERLDVRPRPIEKVAMELSRSSVNCLT